jgi:predicted Co/Zn/Cd cation transporter (cation efflux family)
MGLAVNSFASMTPRPLYMFGYLGIFITIAAFLLGLAVFVEQLLLGDPLHWKFTGTAMLGILIMFLVGIVLMSQGILSLYISRIHNQSKQRPLYVIDHGKSAGIKV